MLALLCCLILVPTQHEIPKLPHLERPEEHRKDRDDQLSSAVLAAAIAHRQMMPAARHTTRQSINNPLSDILSGPWQFIGPRNLDVSDRTFAGPPPVSGRINAAAVDPFDGNTYYAGSGNGGFWKSTDSGINWVCLSDSWEVPKVSCIACDWAHPGTIYVGTGDVPGGGNLAAGIMKTVDGGLHWTEKGASDFGPCNVSGIIIDPVDPNIIVASTIAWPPGEPRVWRSTSAGDSWLPTTLPSAHWHGLAVSARFLDGYANYYATTGFPLNQVWRSHDQGVTWEPITLPAGLTDSALPLTIATSPIWPANAYLLSMEMHKVYKTEDAGYSWIDVTPPPSFIWYQTDFTWCIACSSLGSNDVVYLGDFDIAQSIDGGLDWRIISGPVGTTGALTHVDQHAIAIDPHDPNHTLIGNDGGIYSQRYFPTVDRSTFASLNATLGITELYGAGVDSGDTTKILGGAQDNGNPGADGDLMHWRNIINGDGYTGMINSAAPRIQWLGKFFNGFPSSIFWRTDTNWTSHSDVSLTMPSDPVFTEAPFVMDPGNPWRVYAAGRYLHSWSEIFGLWATPNPTQPLSRLFSVTCISVAPGRSSRIYTGEPQGQLWMTDDYGVDWTEIDGGTTPLPHDYISDISSDPADPNDVLVAFNTAPDTTDPQLWRCRNVTAGSSRVWTPVNGSGSASLPQVPVRCIARDVDASATVHWFVGTSVGAFETPDGGGTWLNATNPLGLPNVRVNKLQSIPASRLLVATTYGRGMWQIPLVASSMAIGMMIIDPGTMDSGAKGLGKVVLTSPAGKYALVPLDCKFDGVVLPNSIVIPQGEISATFEFTATNTTGKKVKTQITAYGTQPVSADLTILPVKK